MARTPNYNFERQERDRAKAAKKKAKAEQKARDKAAGLPPTEDDDAPEED